MSQNQTTIDANALAKQWDIMCERAKQSGVALTDRDRAMFFSGASAYCSVLGQVTTDDSTVEDFATAIQVVSEEVARELNRYNARGQH